MNDSICENVKCSIGELPGEVQFCPQCGDEMDTLRRRLRIKLLGGTATDEDRDEMLKILLG